MIKKFTLLFSLLLILRPYGHVNAQDSKYVEIFDPSQAKVVKTVQLTPEIQSMMEDWVKNINGIYHKNDPVTDDGYAVRVPLDPAVIVHSRWLKSIVTDVYIIVPEKDPPFYLIFDDDYNLCCFSFNGDIERLSKSLDFQLKINK
jgi:hypothetical protein